MKCLLFADVHVHRWPQFAVPDPKYNTNRLGHILCCLRDIKEYALANDIKLAICIGDLGHLRGIIHVVVWNLIREVIKEFKEAGITLVLVAGNHDQANKSGTETSIKCLEEYANVIEQFKIERLPNGLKVAYIPFSECRQTIVDQFQECRSKQIDYVFSHIPVAGSRLSVDYKSSSNYEITIEEIQPAYFVGVALGHYHTSQFLTPNLFYVGSLAQQSLSDVGQAKGFWEVDLVKDSKQFTKSLKFIKSKYPEFNVVNIEDKKALLAFYKRYNPDDFYKVFLGSGMHLPTEEFPNIMVVSKIKEEENQVRIKGLDQMSPEDIILNYVKFKDGTESALDYGLSILNRLQREKENK